MTTFWFLFVRHCLFREGYNTDSLSSTASLMLNLRHDTKVVAARSSPLVIIAYVIDQLDLRPTTFPSQIDYRFRPFGYDRSPIISRIHPSLFSCSVHSVCDLFFLPRIIRHCAIQTRTNTDICLISQSWKRAQTKRTRKRQSCGGHSG